LLADGSGVSFPARAGDASDVMTVTPATATILRIRSTSLSHDYETLRG
jgi:hypothetical protein